MAKRKHITFKVWLEIEQYNEKTGDSQDLDAPGSSLAEFGAYEEAWAYAERVTRLAEGINLDAPARALVLDLVRHGLMDLSDGQAYFDGVDYGFDDNAPDWTALVNAIGWNKARAAIERMSQRPDPQWEPV